QEPQGMAARLRGRDHRQERFGKGVCKLDQGHRSPERRSKSGTLIVSWVVVPSSSLRGSASPPGTGLNLTWRPLMHPRNAATYRAAAQHSDCGRGLVPKDAESMGREDKPLLDFSSK